MSDKGTAAVDQAAAGNDVERLSYAQQFHRWMLAQAKAYGNGDSDAITITDNQVERILTAESEDAIWDADLGGAVQGRDVGGLEVTIRGYRPMVAKPREDVQNDKGYYISMDCTVIGGPREVLTRNMLAIGADVQLQTGAPLIIAKVRAMEAREMLPVNAMILAIPTAAGNNVLKLARIPERAAQGSSSAG